MRVYLQITLISLLMWSTQALGAETTDSSADENEASSYPYALALNAQSVRVMDVLMKSEDFHDISANEYIRDVTLLRMCINRDQQRFLTVQKAERRILAGDGDEQRKVILLGAHFRDGRMTTTQFDGKQRQMEISFDDALKRLNLIDIRFVGFSEFPTFSSDRTNFDELVAASKILTGCRLHPYSANQVDVYRTVQFLNAPDEFRFTRWRFDTETLVPISYYKELRRKLDGKPVVYPMCRENYEWRETNGVYIPVQINGTSRSTTEDDRRLAYEIDKNAQFHWFSVNEAIY